MSHSWSRRGILSAFAATLTAAPEKPATAPSELRRLRDPATEFELLRLTDPTKASAILPGPPSRVAIRGGGLIYCSDRTGSMQVWRMDTKTGVSQQLTRADSLNPAAVTLTPDERTLAYMDGPSLTLAGGKRTQIVYTVENGWDFAGNLSLGDDGTTAALSETRAGRYRLRVVSLKRSGPAATLFEAAEPLRYCRVRPKRPGLLYNHNGVLTLGNLDGRGSKRLATQGAQAGFALWTADGRALHYLSVPEGRGSVQLREHTPESGEDKLIGNTTQFVTFDRNADASVFVGASGSKAAPYILLLVRAGRREMTLAEHKASAADRASVVFSANSQRLFYNTDREGKPAIYSIALEKFVEDTDAGESAGAEEDKPGKPPARRR